MDYTLSVLSPTDSNLEDKSEQQNNDTTASSKRQASSKVRSARMSAKAQMKAEGLPKNIIDDETVSTVPDPT